MNQNNLPNFPDDTTQPFRPDLKRLWISISIIFWVLFISVWFFYTLSYFFISNFSLEQEQKYFWEFSLMWEEQKLSLDFLEQEIQIPEHIDIYVVEDDEINAFASLWWKIFFTTGILENFQTNEEFLFVLWHEIDHIVQRDVIKSLTLEMPISLSLLFLWIDTSLQKNFFYDLWSSFFSRQIELRADNAGIDFVKNHGKNPECILPFFEEKNNIFDTYLSFHSTHPSNEDRISQIKQSKHNFKNKECSSFSYKK